MSAQPQPAPQQGTLYDLAYKRYEGPRSAPTWRFFVIVRHAVLAQLRSKWIKALLMFGLISITIKAGVAALAMLQGAAAIAMGRADAATRIDAMVGESIVEGAVFASFLIMLVGGAPAISNDLNAGAFQFYFARPISRPQYLLARVLGTATWPLVLALVSLVAFVGAHATLVGPVPHALALGAKAVGPMLLRLLVLAAIASGVSSITRRRGLAQALFAGLVVGSLLVASLAARLTHHAWIDAFGPTGSAEALGKQLFGSTEYVGWHAALPAASCAAWIGVFLGLAYWRLTHAEVVRG